MPRIERKENREKIKKYFEDAYNSLVNTAVKRFAKTLKKDISPKRHSKINSSLCVFKTSKLENYLSYKTIKKLMNNHDLLYTAEDRLKDDAE